MKKILYVLIIAVFAFSAFALGACSDKTPDAISSQYEDLASKGKFASDSGSAGDCAVFDFGKEVLINTVVLKEKESNITSFRIYADGKETPVYGNDFVGGYRYCAFDGVKTRYLKIEVLSSDAEWKLTDLEAYLILKEADDFEVMSYIYADTAYCMSDGQAEIAQAVTQFNVFGCTYFDAEGEIVFVDYEIDGKTVAGREVLAGAVRKLREVNPGAELVVTVLGNRDFGDGLTTIERHNSATGKYADSLTANLTALIAEFGFDGVSFDYEYPERESDFDTFAAYIAKLDKALGDDLLLTAAISDWCIGGKSSFTAEDLQPLDAVEVMAYDLFDERGNHSSFYSTCYWTLKNLEKKGIDLKKVNLGLPFYSRPIDKGAYWGSYEAVANKLGPYENSMQEAYVDLDGVEHEPTTTYYNGRQTIYDKTRYAIDSGAGGVMIWHFACDSTDPDLSLLNQIAAAKKGKYSI